MDNQQPIPVQYILTLKEIKNTLIFGGRIKDRLKGNIVKSVIILMLIPVFTIQYITSGYNMFLGVLLIGVSLAVGAALWIVPEKAENERIKQSADGRNFHVTIAENKITAAVNGEATEIPLDGEAAFLRKKELFIIFVGGGKLLIIPERAFASKEEAEKAAEMIQNGTRERIL